MPRKGYPPPRSPATALPWLVTAMAIGIFFTSCQASAQTAPDARGQAAYADWRRLPQNEVNCADRSLRAQGTTLWIMIQRGMHPSDPAVARIRAACRAQAQNQTQPQAQSQATAQPKAPAVTAPNAAQALASASETAAEKAEADRAAAAKAAADKAEADRAATAKAVAEKLESDKKAIAKAAAEKAAAERADLEKVAAAKLATEKADADRVAAVKIETEKADADRKAGEKAAVNLAKAEAERIQVQADASRRQADTERARKELEAAKPEITPMVPASELRMSFLYGLLSGPVLVGLGGFGFMMVQRRRSTSPRPDVVGYDKLAEIHRLVKVVLSETERRERAAGERPQPERTHSERAKALEE